MVSFFSPVLFDKYPPMDMECKGFQFMGRLAGYWMNFGQTAYLFQERDFTFLTTIHDKIHVHRAIFDYAQNDQIREQAAVKVSLGEKCFKALVIGSCLVLSYTVSAVLLIVPLVVLVAHAIFRWNLSIEILPEIDKALNDWIADPKAKGNKIDAAKNFARLFVDDDRGNSLYPLKAFDNRGYYKGAGLNTLPRYLDQFFPGIENLYLNGNKFTSVPEVVSKFPRLRYLDLSNNPDLTDLPDSLEELSGLTDIDIRGTQISETRRNAILSVCRAKRDEKSHLDFSKRVQTWLTQGKHQIDPKAFDNLQKNEIKILNEWLYRLEGTAEYKKNQEEVGKVVCGMLETLVSVKEKDQEFKALFFFQAEENNADCGDRAAMSLNLIYAFWSIHQLPEEAPLKNKITLMIQAAKMTSIYGLITQKININDKNNRESVEIYLYYINALKKKLGLFTAVNHMLYTSIGKRLWLDQDQLEQEVNDTYLQEFTKLSLFPKLVESNEDFQKLWSESDEKYGDELELLYLKKPLKKEGVSTEGFETDEEKQWRTMVDDLTQKRELAKTEAVKKWLKTIL